MFITFILVGFLPLSCYGAALPYLYSAMDLSSQVLSLVQNKFYFMKTAVDKQQQGLANLRAMPINEYQISALEPQLRQLVGNLQQVVSNPSLINNLDSSVTSTMIDGLASLRKILPPSTSDFAAQYALSGPYNMISMAIAQINNIIKAVGY
ncbi:unnamed protein product [Nippostrongylus brasiliensis]|uniref:DUF148 domain-containing protein n=1 Tax=Nippostrongylus brasiliensis TaxID=27835 RepID=A0A0N4Y0P7_NIPBR|nr:hypothetical protein Q1695_009237 [Nippostrongylus brasiliensis]VDL72716.1 unnamed protein product [Nippostrongylus brasiliensis]